MAEIRNLTRNGETFYPLTTSSAVINEATGEGLIIDDEPTAGSNNLVKSGGVIDYVTEKVGVESDVKTVTEFTSIIWDGHVVTTNHASWKSVLFPLIEGASYDWSAGVNPVVFSHIPHEGDTDGTSVDDGFTATDSQKYLLLTESVEVESVIITISGFGILNDYPKTKTLAENTDNIVGRSQLVSKNITNDATQLLGEAHIKSGEKYLISCSGNFHANWIVIATDINLTNRLIDDQDYHSGKSYTTTPITDGEELFIFMRGDESYGTLSLKIQNGLISETDNLSEQLDSVDDRLGVYYKADKNIQSETTQIILNNINLKNGLTYTIKFNGDFCANWVILAADANLSYRLVETTDYKPGSVYKITLSQNVDVLYLWMRNITQYGSFEIEITSGVCEKVYDGEVEKIERIIGTIPTTLSLGSDNYLDLVYDVANHNIVSVPHSSTWNCVTIPVKYGFTYKIFGGVRAFEIPEYPYAGMSDSGFVEPDINRITITSHTSKFLLIQTNTEIFPAITVIVQKNGYLDLSEYGKIGICLGDSNMQATSVAVTQNEDPGAILGQILGAKVFNGGIGGTTYADMGSERPLNFTELCDAIKTRDFTQFDTDLDSFITAHPDCAYLRDRWQGIKDTPITNVDFVVIAYGTNDWTASRTIDNPNNAFDKTTILGALRYGVKTLLEANPKLRLYIITPAYRFDLFDDINKDSDNTQINGVYLYEICDLIYECCHGLHTPCLNYYYTCGSNKYNRDAILNGGTHRTRYGYELMAQQYAKFILSY